MGSKGLGVFCGEDCPLTVFYLPARTNAADGDIKIHAVSKRDAIIELIRNTFNPIRVNALVSRERQMDFLMRLVSKVPMRRVVYPSGYHNLARVTEAVIKEIV